MSYDQVTSLFWFVGVSAAFLLPMTLYALHVFFEFIFG